jgi:transcriptional regulator with XRE-family HTH domain
MTTPQQTESLARRVARIRARKRLTLRDVALAGGMSHVSVGEIERGINADPKLGTLRSLARGLGVSLELLVRP